jgi:hypothetical protein
MHVRNGDLVAVQAVGVLPLHLPSRVILELSNCYYVPALCKNIISGSCLSRDGYSFKCENNGCSIYLKDTFYGCASGKNGLFIMDLECSNLVFNTDAKHLKMTNKIKYHIFVALSSTSHRKETHEDTP